MTGVGGNFAWGNGVPRDLWHRIFSHNSFYHFGAAVVISSTIAIVWSMEEVFAHEDEFPLAIFVVV